MATKPRHVQHIPLAVVYAVLGAFFIALSSLIAKIIGTKVSIDTIVFARFTTSLFVILPWVLKNPREAIKVDHPRKLIFRSFFSLLSINTWPIIGNCQTIMPLFINPTLHMNHLIDLHASIKRFNCIDK